MKPQSIETRWLNEALARLGLTPGDMDQRCGFTKGTFTRLRAQNFPSRPSRARVEQVINAPVWSTARIVELRAKAVAILGFNPGTLTRPQLLTELRKLGLKARTDAKLEVLEEILLSHLAPKNPENKPL